MQGQNFTVLVIIAGNVIINHANIVVIMFKDKHMYGNCRLSPSKEQSCLPKNSEKNFSMHIFFSGHLSEVIFQK